VALQKLHRRMSTLTNGAWHHNVFAFDFIQAST
jgi:hypothetical protein